MIQSEIYYDKMAIYIAKMHGASRGLKKTTHEPPTNDEVYYL